MQLRIGDRDPVTGLYDVIWPDGSSTRNGIKAFNATHQTGDVVLATKRSDGMMVLDSVKAIDTNNRSSWPANPDLVNPPPDYLQGQVFNREEEELPVLSIALAPGIDSVQPEWLALFTVEVRLDRPISREFRFRIDLSGTASPSDYIAPNFTQDLIIPAGSSSYSFNLDPVSDGIDETAETIVATLQPVSQCKIGQSSVTMTIDPNSFVYKIYTRLSAISFGSGPLGAYTIYTTGAWTVVEQSATLLDTAANRAIYEAQWDLIANQNRVLGSPGEPIFWEFAGPNADYDAPLMQQASLGVYVLVSPGAPVADAQSANHAIVFKLSGDRIQYRRERYFVV